VEICLLIASRKGDIRNFLAQEFAKWLPSILDLIL
jgi:hypothetical protein